MDMESKKFNRGMVFTLISIVVAGIIGLGIYNSMTLKNTEGTLHRTKLENSQLTIDLDNKTKLVNTLKLTVEELKKTPVDTSHDAILEDHIFVYIDKKYQLVPKTSSKEIAHQIVVQSRAANVSPELVVGIIAVESAFDASAVSKANARGLMQVMPEWARKFNLKKVSDLHDIDTGIECGIKVLKIHVEEEGGNLTRGLYKYVGGSDVYAGKVYTSIGKFVAFRSTVEDNDIETEKEIDVDTIKQ